MTHPSLDELVAWRDGEASPEIMAHVDQCPLCRTATVELGSLREDLRALPAAEPPANGWAAVKAE